MNTNAKALALFDFDGTLTTHDTLLEIIRFAHGERKFWLWMLGLSPYLIAFKAGLLHNQKAKEKVLQWFFGGMEASRFHDMCDRFVAERVPALLRPEGMKRLAWHRSQGHRILLVSASPESWLAAWAQQNGMECVASKMEVKQGKITGRLDGFNCYGPEKARRIKLVADLAQYEQIYAYGDSSGDREMLALATHPFYKPFRGRSLTD